jgi:hypothetical protein
LHGGSSALLWRCGRRLRPEWLGRACGRSPGPSCDLPRRLELLDGAGHCHTRLLRCGEAHLRATVRCHGGHTGLTSPPLWRIVNALLGETPRPPYWALLSSSSNSATQVCPGTRTVVPRVCISTQASEPPRHLSIVSSGDLGLRRAKERGCRAFGPTVLLALRAAVTVAGADRQVVDTGQTV